MDRSFGIVIACHRGDFSLAQGACASIRYFLGDMPICLIVDGNFSTRKLEKMYGIIRLDRNNIKDQFLRENSFGWGFTKMIALWESPFERFLYFDADAVLWGTINPAAILADYDIVIDRTEHLWSEEDLERYFFRPHLLKQLIPDFDFRECFFACMGVFMGKRNAFPLSEYQFVFGLHQQYPDLFKCGDNGMFNVMIFRALAQRGLKVGREPIQYMTPNVPRQVLAERFAVNGNGPCANTNISQVLHWCGTEKPYLRNRHAGYHEPMIFFRRKYLRDCGFLRNLFATWIMHVDEIWLTCKNRYYKILKYRLGKLLAFGRK